MGEVQLGGGVLAWQAQALGSILNSVRAVCVDDLPSPDRNVMLLPGMPYVRREAILLCL